MRLSRARSALAAFALIVAASALYTFTRPKVYQATATLAFLPDEPPTDPVSSGPRDDSFHTARRTAGDPAFIEKVAESLPPEVRLSVNRNAGQRHPLSSALRDGLLLFNEPDKLSLSIAFRHRDRSVVAHVANRFVEELANAQHRKEADAFESLVQILTRRVAGQREKTARLAELLAARRSSSDFFNQQPNDSLAQELAAEEATLAALLAEMRQRLTTAPRSHLGPITLATPPAPDAYVSPNHRLHLGFGTLLGLLGAVAATRRHRPRPTA